MGSTTSRRLIAERKSAEKGTSCMAMATSTDVFSGILPPSGKNDDDDDDVSSRVGLDDADVSSRVGLDASFRLLYARDDDTPRLLLVSLGGRLRLGRMNNRLDSSGSPGIVIDSRELFCRGACGCLWKQRLLLGLKGSFFL